MTRYLFALLTLLLAAGNAFAVLFTAEDKAFTMDLPAAWVSVNTEGAVISLKKGGATLQIRPIQDCSNAACLEEAVNKELASIKAKRFKVVENTYTGEVIKKTEFSTGDPLFSFSFSGAAVDFSTAGFLADGKAYMVNIKGLPYVEADLVLSFISPAPKPVNPNDGAALPNLGEPSIGDISLDDHLPLDMPAASAEPAAPKIQAKAPPKDAFIKTENIPAPVCGVFVAIMFFSVLFISAFILKLILPSKNTQTANPMSGYPIKGERLYGSPDLFFKMHDNQGNNFISTSTRWGSIFMGFGLFAAIGFFIFKTVLSALFQQGHLNMHLVIVNTLMSVSSLATLLSLILFIAGLFVDVLFPSKLFFYDKGGYQVYKCVPKGFFFFKEQYLIADSKTSAVVFRLIRNRFTLKRKWTVKTAQEDIAVIKERSALKALLRLCFGHLSGFLRADYIIKGRVESSGALISSPRHFTAFRCDLDKPEAVDPQVMLIASSLIFMRDRDKWFPWVN